MARVEKNESVQKEVAAMKDEMVQTVKMTKKKSLWTWGCLILVIAFFVTLIGGLSWAAAATGLVKVPVLTKLAYEAPAPHHFVEPGMPLDTHINDELTAEINRRLVAGRGQLTDREITMHLPEDGFTALLKTLVEESGVKEITSTGAQVAVIPGQGLELFLPLADNPQQSALIVWLQVEPTPEGLLDIKIMDMQLGALHLPGYIYGPIIEPLLQQNLDQLNRDFSRYATFEKIEYRDDTVFVTGSIAVEILDL